MREVESWTESETVADVPLESAESWVQEEQHEAYNKTPAIEVLKKKKKKKKIDTFEGDG
jgi:hypothetical protein